MKNQFMAGLIILLPLVFTIMILSWTINLLTAPFLDLVSSFLAQFPFIHQGVFFLTTDQLNLYLSKFLIILSIFLIITYICHS